MQVLISALTDFKNYSDRIASYNVKLNYLSPANILEARENLLRNYYYKLNNSINAVMKIIPQFSNIMHKA